MTPSSAVGAAIATTSSASFCQSFKRFRNCMTPSILVVPTRSKFLPLAAVPAGIGLDGNTDGGSSSRFGSGRGCGWTFVGSIGPWTAGLATLAPDFRSEFLGAGHSTEAAAGGCNSRQVIPTHHLVQGGRFGRHVLRRCGGLLHQRGVLLGQLIHLHDGAAYLLDTE